MDEKRSWFFSEYWKMVGSMFVVVVLFLAIVLGGTVLLTKAFEANARPKHSLRTVEHDGHKFVEGLQRGAPVHHPDCPCGKAQ